MSIRAFRGFGFAAAVLVLAFAAGSPASAIDCNANGVEDDCDLDCGVVGGSCDVAGCGLSADCDANGVPDTCDLAVGAGACAFPQTLSGNTTGFANSLFLGAPDDTTVGIGGQVVTYQLDCAQAFDGPGPDLTVYEFDGFSPEFSIIDVLISDDGVNFFSIRSSESAAINIAGDEFHGDNSYARSYDFAMSGLSIVRFVRIDGDGDAGSAQGAGFELDAIGLIHRGSVDCDGNGLLDRCETPDDCDADGVSDCLAFVTGTEFDCNANAIPDSCDSLDDCDGNAVPDLCDLAVGSAACAFPQTLSENTTGSSDGTFLGPPDDTNVGIGGQIVTYELDCAQAFDGPGPDMTVYEFDGFSPEFSLIDVLVSDDGANFFSISSSESAAINIPGDESHGSNSYARSYDFAASGLGVVRFIRIDGDGDAPSGSSAGFELDAIGLIHRASVDCDGNELLDRCEAPADCDSDGVSDCLAFVAGTEFDCNANIIPDSCEPQDDCDGNGTQDICDVAANGTGCAYPLTIPVNTTTFANSDFVGAPDDTTGDLFDNQVVFEFDCGFIVDGPGPDLTVYEADGALAEFDELRVLVSDDDVTYIDITGTEAAAVAVPGDEIHGDPAFARSYELSGSGLRAVRFVRLDGMPTDGNGFDLDAIGAVYRGGLDCDGSGILDSCEVLADCDANSFPDSCDLVFDPDCNVNGTLDECDIASGSFDVDLNAEPDECQDDCDGNAVPDEFEIAQGNGTECNGNGVLDLCDITEGSSIDCNADGVPDECAVCPPVEVAFIMDTSDSMSDEAAELCAGIAQATTLLAARGITAQTELLGVIGPGSGIYSCLTDGVATSYGTTVPGSPPPGNETLGDCPGGAEAPIEDWGRAVSVTSANKAWTSGNIRLVVPLSDEGPWCGDPVSDPGVDRDSITHAIGTALINDVVVSPVAASGASQDVVALANDLAEGTGGGVADSSDLLVGIVTLIEQACDTVTDCNGNDRPDSCELADGSSQDCDSSGVPDECELDCNGNGLHDSCDVSSAGSDDLNTNGVPDECEYVRLTLSAAELDWTEAEGATGYDVVSGELGVLRSTDGNFTAATDDCVVDDLAALTTPHAPLSAPAAGEGQWFLVRAVNWILAQGYETFLAGQVGSRDPEIAASPTPCP